jgi:hypothetical protein
MLLLLMFAYKGKAATVVPGQSTVAGQSLGQWTNNWWNWAESFGPGPFTDTTGAVAGTNQSGPVFFLAGSGGNAGPITRNVTVGDDKYILLPLINWIVAAGPDPGFADTKTEAIALATNTINPANLFATIDGVPVSNLASHREASGSDFSLTFVNNNDSGFPAGTFNDAYGDGYYLMLNPLTAGAHTLHFGGTSTFFDAGAFQVAPFTIDVTVNLNVVAAGGPSTVPLPAAIFAGPLGLLPAMVLRKRFVKRKR